MGPSSAVFEKPAHPYTQALVSAIPGCGPRIRLDGEISSPIDPPPTVCRFASRCPAVMDRCLREAPALKGPDLTVAACHLASWQARPAVSTAADA
jgi:oligopeptide/dipeptide ABC transporter ATP-binding protein